VASLALVSHHVPLEDAADEATASILIAARLYYEENLSQQQVAARLGVSRSSVSRLLQAARDQGIVHIEIRPPSIVSGVGARLAASLGLRRAIAAPAPARGHGTEGLVAPTLAELERLGLGSGDVLAVSWGATISAVAQARRFPQLRGVRLLPAIAGLDEADVHFQTNEIARRIAHASGADVSFLHAPALPTKALRDSLLADPDLAERLALWDRLSAALVGIGRPPAELPVGPAHIMFEQTQLGTAVGDVASRHFDLEGNAVELEREDQLLGVSRAQLRAAGTVIGVAAGLAKARSIVGAARAGLIDVLVTDSVTAAAALELSEATR
jgi:DNA-binding transcriptional regulator LsrR (DeoR family)